MSKLTPDVYYGEYYKLIKSAEEQLELSIYRCLDANDTHKEKIAKYISSRIKSPESVEEKLKRKNYPSGVKSAISNICDIVGVRIVVRFMDDIYTVKEMIENCGEFKIIEEKDYVANPKSSGYRSYHLIVEVEVEDIKIHAEIQLRTMAMDCWASIEHQIRYKKEIENIELISSELKSCSESLFEADITMGKIKRLVEKNSTP